MSTVETKYQAKAHKDRSRSSKRQYLHADNSILVWLDCSTASYESNLLVDQLAQNLNREIKIFINADQCIDFITDCKNKKIFLILSDSTVQNLIPQIHDIPALQCIYILSSNDDYLPLKKRFFKIQSISPDLSILIDVLKTNLKYVDINLQLPTLLRPVNLQLSNKESELDAMFMYYQLLKEIFLEMKHDEYEAKRKLVEFCQHEYEDNRSILKVIDEFCHDYTKENAIRWYTRDTFVYRMLNGCLRLQDIEAINKFAFFIKDLHRQLEECRYNSSSDTFFLYRGQGMFTHAFNELKQNVGGLISFNYFLSTSADQTVALGFAIPSLSDPEAEAVLFVIEVDPTVTLHSPVAALNQSQTNFAEEREYLWGMNSIFRITYIQQMDNGVWQVNLQVTSDDDPQLKQLTDYMRRDINGSNGHERLAQLMIRMSEWIQAKEIYESLLSIVDNDDRTKLAFLHHQLGYIARQTGDLDQALQHYQQVLTLDLTHMSNDDQRLVSVYSNIALILYYKGELDRALEQYQQALAIEEHANEPNYDQLTGLLQNMGSVLQEQGRVEEALRSYLRVATVQDKYLPAIHPHRARTCNSIAVITAENGDHQTALIYFNNALTIQERTLSKNHIEVAIIHSNIAACLTFLGQFNDALVHAIKARDIGRHTLSSNHRDLKEFENMVMRIQSRL